MQDVTIKIEERIGDRLYFVETILAGEVIDDFKGHVSAADIAISRMRDELAVKIKEDQNHG